MVNSIVKFAPPLACLPAFLAYPGFANPGTLALGTGFMLMH